MMRAGDDCYARVGIILMERTKGNTGQIKE